MPIYEYECQAGHRFEILQRMSDAPLTQCQDCEAPAQRVISSTSFILKGSGWYVTDYAKKNSPSKSEKPAEGGGDGGGGEGGGATAEAKPATTPETTKKTGGASSDG